MGLLPPEEEFEGQFSAQRIESDKSYSLDRIFNYINETGVEFTITRLSDRRFVIKPKGKGKSLDVWRNAEWSILFMKNIFTKRGRKKLEKLYLIEKQEPRLLRAPLLL